VYGVSKLSQLVGSHHAFTMIEESTALLAIISQGSEKPN
jgi:hypothetical protein